MAIATGDIAIDLTRHDNSTHVDLSFGVYEPPYNYANTSKNASPQADDGAESHGLPPLLHSSGMGIEYLTPLIFSIIFIIGVVGNATLIYIVARNKELRNTPNIFIVSLASGDLLLILVAVPFSATYFTFNYWPYGMVICKLNEFMQTLSLGVSVFTLVALSGDRYVAIVYPMSKHKGSATLRTALIAGGIWILAGTLAIMDLVKTELVYVPLPDNITKLPICFGQSMDETDPYARFRTMFRFGVYFAVPVLVICSFYVLMARILILSSKSMPGDSKMCSQASRQVQARKKVAKVVLSFVVIFVICWLPYYMYRIWYYFLPGDFNTFWLFFKVAAFCLAFINSCVNPFALYFLSKQFRAHYNRYLFCCFGRVLSKRNQNGEYTTTLYQFKKKANGGPSNSLTMTTSHTAL